MITIETRAKRHTPAVAPPFRAPESAWDDVSFPEPRLGGATCAEPRACCPPSSGTRPGLYTYRPLDSGRCHLDFATASGNRRYGACNRKCEEERSADARQPDKATPQVQEHRRCGAY